MAKAKHSWLVKVRNHSLPGFVQLWLVRRDGPADSPIMWAETIPAAAKEIIELLGLPVENETGFFRDQEPLTPPECVSVAKQRELFAQEEVP